MDASTLNGKKVGINKDRFRITTYREWATEKGIRSESSK